MKWLSKTSVGEFKTDGSKNKFLSASLVEGESVEDVLDYYIDQWQGEGIEEVDNLYIAIIPWHPTTYKAYNDPETGKIGWEPC